MADPSDRERLIQAQDRLFDLLVQHDEARHANDALRVTALKRQIDAAKTRHDELRRLLRTRGQSKEPPIP
jgi:hypothetical protein